MAPARQRRRLDQPGVWAFVGNTPLIPLPSLSPEGERVSVYAKAEWFNPGGSVKDRAALGMIEGALEDGRLAPGRVLLDSSSGNTGIAYAMLGAALGYPVEVCLPENASLERKRLIQAYGAVIHSTDPLEGSEGARVLAQEMYEADPDRYFMPDQYNNPANPGAHYRTTGPEIVRQTEGRITHFLAGIGTGGTLMGTGRYLKEWARSGGREMTCCAVEPDHPMHGLEGMKHMASAVVPGIYDEGKLDGKFTVRSEDAYDAVARLARRDGLLVGPSSGAVAWAAGELAQRLASEGREGLIVTVFPDSGARYATSSLWEILFGEA